MVCALTHERHLALIGNIYKRLKTFAEDPKQDNFNLRDFVSDIYDLVYNKNKDREQALGIAYHVPSSINMALLGEEELLDKLRDKGFKRDTIDEIASYFKKNGLQVVGDYISWKDPVIEKKIEKIGREEPPITQVPKKGTSIADKSLAGKLEELSEDFKATPLNYNVSTGQEGIKSPRGGYENTQNPIEKPYYDVMKGLLNAMDEQGKSAEETEFGGHKGFKLVAMLKSSFKEADPARTTGKFILVLTDLEGNFLKFDNDNMVTKGQGKVIYQSLRTETRAQVEDFIKDVVSRYKEKVSKAPYFKLEKVTTPDQEANNAEKIDKLNQNVEAFRKEFAAGYKAQYDITYQMVIKNLDKDPQAKIPLDITGGSMGYFSPKVTDIEGNLDISEEEFNSISIREGRPYIKLKGISRDIEMRGKLAPAYIIENVAQVLTRPITIAGIPLTAKQKVDYFNQFISPKTEGSEKTTGILLDEKDGEILLQINGKTIDVNNKDAEEEIIRDLKGDEQRKGAYIHVFKPLIKSKTYDYYQIDKNTATRSTPSYSSLILPLLSIMAQPNSSKRVEELNGYFSWEPGGKVMSSDKEELQAPNTQANKIADDFSDHEFDLEMNKIIQEKGSPDQIVEAMRWWKNNPLSKHIKLELLMNIVNSNAWATWSRSGIKLYQGSDYTHAYHEAWHAFSQLYLTKGEKTKLYDEVAKLKGTFKLAVKNVNSEGVTFAEMKDIEFSKATPRQLEEYIAEEFRKYALSKGKKAQPKATDSIFKKIWNFLKALFTGVKISEVASQDSNTDPLADIFHKLYVGDINQYTPSEENIIFDSANSGIVALSNINEGLNYAESKLLSDSIDGIWSKLISTWGTQGNNKATITAFKPANQIKMYAHVLKELVKRRDILTEEYNANKDTYSPQTEKIKANHIRILNFAVREFGDASDVFKGEKNGVIAFHVTHSQFKDELKVITKDEPTPQFDDNGEEIKSSDPQDSVEDINSTLRAGYERGAATLSMKQMASGFTLYLIRSLVEVNKEGVDQKNELGFPRLASFPTTWNSLVRTTTGVKGVEELYDRLTTVSNSIPVFKQILNKLGDPHNSKTTDEFVMWHKFLQDFNKPRIPLIQMIVEKSADEYEVDDEGNRRKKKYSKEDYIKRFTYKIGRASADYFRIQRDWESKFNSQSPEGNKFIKVDSSRNNYLNTKLIVDTFLKKTYVEKSKKNFDIKYELKNPQRSIDFLRSVGIYMSDIPAVRSALYDMIDQINYIADSVGLAYEAEKPVYNPVHFLKETQKGMGVRLSFNENQTNTEPSKRPETIKSQSGVLQRLASLQAEYSDEFSSLSRITADGKKQYEQSLNSTMSVKVDALNKVSNYTSLYNNPNPGEYYSYQHMSFLNPRSNPWSNKSQILNSLYVLDSEENYGVRRMEGQGQPVTLDMYNLSGAQILTIGDYSSRGVAHSSMGAADKFITDFHSLLSAGYIENARHGAKSTAYANKVSKIHTYLGKQQDHLYVDTTAFMPGRNGYQAHVRHIVLGYLEAEVKRIAMIQANKDFYDKVVGFENASQFALFDDILAGKNVNEPGTTKNLLLSPEVLKSIEEMGSLEQALIAHPKLMKQVDSQLEHYFSELYKRYETNLLSKYDAVNPKVYEEIMDLMGKTKEEKEAMLEEPVDIADMRRAALKSFMFNGWIHKVEMMILFYGDAAHFKHSKEEFHKRNSTFGSTGYIFGTDRVSQKYINTLVQREYSKKNNMPAVEYDGTFKTAVIKDNIPYSVYYENLDNLFRTEAIRKLKPLGLSPKKLKEAIDIELYGDGTYDSPGKTGKMNAFAEPNEGDGQGWVTFDTYRILKSLEGKWSPAQEEAYQKVINGETIAGDEIKELFPVYKLQYAGPLKTDPGILPINAIHKFSLFPLIPSVIKGKAMETLHNRMVEQGVDYALFESGSKLCSITSNNSRVADDIYEGDNTEDIKSDFTFTPNIIYANYLKNQLDVNSEYKGATRFATQLRGLLSSGLMENGLPKDWKTEYSHLDRVNTWEKLSEQEREKQSSFYKDHRSFEKSMTHLVNLTKEKLLKQLGWKEDSKTGKLSGPMPAMINFIKEEFKRQGFSKHELDYIDFDGEGNLIRDLSGHFSADRIERSLMSIVNNRIIRQKVKGEALVEVSIAFTQDLKFKRPTTADLAKYGTSGLPFYITDSYDTDEQNILLEKGAKAIARKLKPTTAMKIKIALQGDFENLFKVKHLDGDSIEVIENGKVNFDKSLARLNESVRDDKWLDQGHNRKAVTVTGVRIPIQGLNSMEFMEVYEFLPPIAGPIIILPTEIVAKSGTDFDVDKLTMYMPHITSDGLWTVNGYMGPTSTIDDRIKGMQNQLIQDIRAILEKPESAALFMQPNGTYLTKPLADHLENIVQDYDFKKSIKSGGSRVSKGVSPTRIFEEDYNLKKHQDNIVGRGALGIAAIANKFSPIFNAAGTTLPSEVTIKLWKKLPTLDRNGNPLKTKEGNIIYNRKATQVDTTIPVKLLLDHREVEEIENGVTKKLISMSSLTDANNDNSISDVISQLMNGFLDVEKDAWVAYLQGNKEVTPMILFLLEAGVPLKEAIYFVSNPLTRMYIQEMRTNKGVFSEMLLNQDNESKFARPNARRAVWQSLGMVEDFPNIEQIEKIIGDEKFSLDTLKSIVENKKLGTSDAAVKGFLHYIYLEEMARGYEEIKFASNVDTKKSSSIFDSELRAEKVEALHNSTRMSNKTINYLQHKSALSGFYSVQKWSSELFSPLFIMRNNNVKNYYLGTIIKDFKKMDQVKTATGYDSEKFIKEFNNEFMSFLFINHIKSFTPGRSKYYKGVRVNASEVKYINGIEQGAHVENIKGSLVLYVNIKQLKKEFRDKAFRAESKVSGNYTSKGFAPVNPAAFETEAGERDYYNFVIEREYLRNILPFNKVVGTQTFLNEIKFLKSTNALPILSNEDPKTHDKRVEIRAYENILRDKALDNSFNYWKMFKSGKDTYAQKMIEIINKPSNAHLLEDYSVLKQFAVKGMAKNSEHNANRFNLVLKDVRDLDEDSTTQYYTEILKLADSGVPKVFGEGPTAIEENLFVSSFFQKLALYAFLQSGLSNNEFTLTSIVPYDKYSAIMDQASAMMNDQLQWREGTAPKEDSHWYIEKKAGGKMQYADIGIVKYFFNEFLEKHSLRNKSTRVRGTDWTMTNTPKALTGELLPEYKLESSSFINRTALPGVYTYSSSAMVDGKLMNMGPSVIKGLIENNSDTYFVFDDPALRRIAFDKGDKEGMAYVDKYLKSGISPVEFSKYSTGKGIRGFKDKNTAYNATPENIDAIKSMIDDDINALIELYKSGKTLVFSEEGYGRDLVKATINTSKTPIAKGKMTYDYGSNKREGVIANSTFEAIKNGERVATTRYEEQGSIEYWKKLKVGDIVEWESAKGEIIQVRVTKPLYKLKGSGLTPEQWSKLEGWSVDYFNSKVKPKADQAWQFQYEYIKDSPTNPLTQEIFEHLSKQLIINFGYINPGSQKIASVKDVIAREEMITQEDIDQKRRKCLGLE